MKLAVPAFAVQVLKEHETGDPVIDQAVAEGVADACQSIVRQARLESQRSNN